MDLIKTIKDYSEKRLSWDEYFMNLSFLISKRSPCSRLNVGCILVYENRVISSGYNGYLPNANHKSVIRDNHEQMINHAEINAITDCSKRGVSTKNSIAYITHFPCINCFKGLVSSGIKEIKYYDDYKNDNLVLELSKDLKIKIIKLK